MPDTEKLASLLRLATITIERDGGREPWVGEWDDMTPEQLATWLIANGVTVRREWRLLCSVCGQPLDWKHGPCGGTPTYNGAPREERPTWSNESCVCGMPNMTCFVHADDRGGTG